MRVGLVLGGGGIVGLAYHAAALAAMELDLGWDARTADVVVGTSAGSVVGALLRRGVPASDLSATAVGASALDSPPGTDEALRQRPKFPPVKVGALVGLPRLPSAALVGAWLRRPWRMDPIAALASVVPDGTLDLAEHTVAVDALLAHDWPADELWICTVRQNDLRRVVLGRDPGVETSLSAAVRASSAVPGYFKPVMIDGRAYVDGGVHSPTNADVLRRAQLDLAIVISPMSGRGLARFGLESGLRRRAGAKVEGERERLRRAGIPSVVIEPGPDVIDLLGGDFMNDERVHDIVGAAFVDTGEQLSAPFTRTLLAGLNERSRRPHTPASAPPRTPRDVDDATAREPGNV